MKTMSSNLSPADLCRLNGWKPGTLLIGDEGYGPCTIQITAVGERLIIAKCILPHDGAEQLWTLNCRDWEEV